jgi:exonuclease III
MDYPLKSLEIMIVVCWNYRGLGNTPKSLAIKDLIKSEKSSILLLQETKMKANEVLNLGKLL